MPIALDATYSIDEHLSGVGVYSREILEGLASAYRGERFLWCYRPHRYMAALRQRLPENCRRFLLHDRWRVPARSRIFHALNQRMPERKCRRSVCTFHDLFVVTGAYSTPEFRARFTRQAIEAAARADLIITVSAFTADQVCSLLHVERSRIRVIHHGVRALPAVSARREPVVLHVGAVQKRKNIVRLVQAFEALPPPWKLILAGSAGFGAGEALERIAASAARDRIEVTGYVSPAALAELYSRASIFAFPSLDEGFGMPVLEAMARGVPVIASNRSALLEVCDDAAILVDPENAEELSDALRRLSQDTTAREDLIRRGVDRAGQFTWEKAVQRTWEIYRELLD